MTHRSSASPMTALSSIMSTIAFDPQGSSYVPNLKVETEPYHLMEDTERAQQELTPASESAEIQKERRLRRKQRRQRKSDRHLDRERQLLADMESYTRGLRQRVEGQTKRLHRRERLARKEELERLRRAIGPSAENYMERVDTRSESELSSTVTADLSSEVSDTGVNFDPEVCFTKVKMPGMTNLHRRIRHLCRYYVTESLKTLGVRTGYEYKRKLNEEERPLAAHPIAVRLRKMGLYVNAKDFPSLIVWNLDDDFFNAAAERAVKEAREERRAKRAAKKKKSQAAKKEVAALKAAMAEQDEVIRKLTEEIKKVTEVGARDRVTDWWNGPEASTPTAPAAKRTTRAPSFNIDDESGPELQIFDQGGKTWVPV